MGLPRLHSCCCGCTIKTGTKVILWFLLIALSERFYLTIRERLEVLLKNFPTSSVFLFYLMLPVTQIASTKKIYLRVGLIGREYTYISSASVTTVWIKIDCSIWIVILMIAIYGVKKGLHWYLVPFLIWAVVDSIIGGVGVVKSVSVQSSNLRDVEAVFLSLWIIYILLGLYFWLVAYSHYQDLKKRPTAPSTV